LQLPQKEAWPRTTQSIYLAGAQFQMSSPTPEDLSEAPATSTATAKKPR